MSGTQRLMLCAIKTESTEGTDVFAGTPSSSDWFAVSSPSITPVTNYINRELAHASGDQLADIPVDSHCDVAFEFDLLPASADGTAPAWGLLMEASGHLETVNASTDVVYTPSTRIDMTNTPSVTVYLFEYILTTNQARLYKTTGVRGQVSFNWTEGQPMRASFAGAGWFSPVASLLSAPSNPMSYQLIGEPPVFQGATITLGGDSCAITAFEFSSRGAVQQRRSAAATGGLDSVLLVAGPIEGSMTFSRNDQDSFAAIVSGYRDYGSLAFACSVPGLALSMPYMQVQTPGMSPGELTTYPVPFKATSDLTSNGGDDSYSITSTAVA
jgi:hypothetical protein